MDPIIFNRIMNQFKNEISFIPQDMKGLDLLLKVQNIINKDGIDSDVYPDKPFLFTTENQHYLDRTLPQNASDAFIILGTGDTLFELLFRGIKNITALEINEIQLLIFKLRLASLKTLSAIDFERFLIDANSHKFLSPEVFKSVKEALVGDEETINVFEHILSKNPKEDIMYHLFKVIDYNTRINKSFLTYLTNKKSYYSLREKAETANFKVVLGDAITYLQTTPKATYDYIDITNILLYIYQLNCHSSATEFKEVIAKLKSIYETNLNPGGTMVLDYWFNHTPENLSPSTYEIQNSAGASASTIYQNIYNALNESFAITDFIIQARHADTVILTRKP